MTGPTRGTLEVPISDLVTEPRLQLTPQRLAWGVVPMGWAVAKPVELRNVGYGRLPMQGSTLTGGSSARFTCKNLPSRPATLPRDGRLAFEVEFRAETAAAFAGAVSIETDDRMEPFQEVALAATGGSCQAERPILNGTPSCASGSCSIGACDAGWHDTDRASARSSARTPATAAA